MTGVFGYCVDAACDERQVDQKPEAFTNGEGGKITTESKEQQP